MKDSRSASQIIFGFLPDQTVDLKGQIWKVREWRTPRRLNEVDPDALRMEICRLGYAWESVQKDHNNFLGKLRAGSAVVEPYAIDEINGVSVDPFPKQWFCKKCYRVHSSPDIQCPCGFGTKGQIPFVAYHDCGELREAYVPRCPTHRQSRVIFSKSASLGDIRFGCPECDWEPTRHGIPFMKCVCDEPMKFNVHRAAVVFSPRSVVLVNPPRNEARRRLEDAGGGARTLTWLLSGMRERSPLELTESRDSLRRDLLSRGIPADMVDRMVEASGINDNNLVIPVLSEDVREIVESQATRIALATLESRARIQDFTDAIPADHELSIHYRAKYPAALTLAGIKDIELIEKFPIFTGHFGFTRGDHAPGSSTLRPLRHHDRTRRRAYPVYGELADTEALLIRLDPEKVAAWLVGLGYTLSSYSNEQEALASIWTACSSSLHGAEIRDQLQRLIHSYSHRFIRTVAVYAGIDRNALSELIMELALSFIVYAVPRGDFVLGGLRAVFERELDTLLAEVVHGERRCPIDPGCAKGKWACMACLHLGEPSCRLFNTQLSRQVLFGRDGYFASMASP